ncbi:hypothetical protein FKM82_029349 [Ascaphus truei]
MRRASCSLDGGRSAGTSKRLTRSDTLVPNFSRALWLTFSFRLPARGSVSRDGFSLARPASASPATPATPAPPPGPVPICRNMFLMRWTLEPYLQRASRASSDSPSPSSSSSWRRRACPPAS